jgi:hypothetical protein
MSSAAAEQLWKACYGGNLAGVQAVVNSTPQEQRAALLRADDSNQTVSLLTSSLMTLSF